MKMARQDNICKFITNSSKDRIVTTNFVFEKNAVSDGKMAAYRTNAVYLVISGKGTLHTEASIKELRPGNVFFSFAQLPFKIENTDNINYMYVSFEGGRSEELFSRFGITPTNCVFEGHEGLVSFWQNSIVKANEKNLDLISEAVLLYTLGEMAPPENGNDQLLIRSILKYIEDNFTDSELNLSSVADALGYNSKYISRIFKKEMGIVFSAYLTNIRIQHAIFLIEQGVTAIKNVAILSGYKDPFYFSNVFKNIVGMAPSEYINKK